MIPVNELRIGNWYEVDATSLTEKSYSVFEDWQQTENYIYDCSPIPITPEILGKCGFRIVNHIHGYSFYTFDRNVENKKHLPPIDWCENKTLYLGYNVKHCESLHQLQNLYFAITGQELNVQL